MQYQTKLWLVCVHHTAPGYLHLVQNDFRVPVAGQRTLTPSTARAATEVATGKPWGSTVWGDGRAGEDYGYRLYRNSYRKIYRESYSD